MMGREDVFVREKLSEKFENVVCAIEESKDIEDITIYDLGGSLEAHKKRKLKKKQESLDVALQTNVIVKEEKAMYVEQGRGSNFRGRGFGRDRGRGRENNHHEMQQPTQFQQNYRGRGRGYGRGGRSYRPSEDVEVDSVVMMAYEVDGTVMMANEEVAPKID
ncbi:hypothetical protein Tco_1334475, partial [Tanacetum coccineum]